MLAPQSVWIIGDKFVKDSVTTNFKNMDNTYSNRNFYISILASDEFTSNNPSTLSRIRNNLICKGRTGGGPNF